MLVSDSLALFSAGLVRVSHTAAHRLALLSLTVVLGALHLFTLDRFPAPFVDEAWLGSRAWGFAQTNRVFGALDAGIFDHYEGYWTFLPWLSTAIQSLPFRLLPAPSLYPLRLLSLLFGGLLLVAVYAISRYSSGRWRAWLAVLLVGTSFPFSTSSHLARWDIMVAAFGFAAITLHLYNRERSPWMAALVGLIAALAFEMHPNGAIFATAIALLFLGASGWRVIFRSDFWSYLTGGILGGLLYLLLHVFPYPATFVALGNLNFGATHIPPLFSFDPFVVARALVVTLADLRQATVATMVVPAPLWPLAVLAFVATLSVRTRRAGNDRELLVLCLALFLGHALLIHNKLAYYSILSSPIVALLLVHTIPAPHSGHSGRRETLHRGGVVALYLLLAVSVGAGLSILRYDFRDDFGRARDGLIDHALPGDRIMGPQPYWFDLHDRSYFAWEAIAVYQRMHPGSSVSDAMRDFRPDLLVLDNSNREYITDRPRESVVYSSVLHISRQELESFLDRYATLQATLDGGSYYGALQIYRIDWKRVPEVSETPGSRPTSPHLAPP